VDANLPGIIISITLGSMPERAVQVTTRSSHAIAT
jgi:hypothetical protein